VGTLPYPEDSATVVIAVEGLANEGDGLALWLKGPGVLGEKKLCVDGLDPAFFETLATINGEFPLGIDVILTDKERKVACIPRSTKVRIA
jgi:alpha-D-ribose 1-methylphosphonate 5-triphosphate synthase subunit PhnH